MEWFLQRLSEYGDRPAVLYHGRSYTYQELHDRIVYFESSIPPKIESGKPVALLSDYSFDAIAAFFSLCCRKTILAPITSKIASEINDKLKLAGIQYSGVIRDGELAWTEYQRTQVASAYESLIKNHNTGLVLFSSGSTGTPKAILHNMDVLLDSYRSKNPKHLRILIFLMFDHIGGLNTMFNALSMGACLILPDSREAEHVCSLIDKYEAHLLPTSPTFLNLLLMAYSSGAYSLNSLRMITYGTEPMPEQLLKRLKSTFPRVRFLQTFGTSETGILRSRSKSSDSLYIKIDDADTEYKIVDQELWLRSRTQAIGYINSDLTCFNQGGWFQTGDLVDVQEDGYLRIIGRRTETINVGGQKVLPQEVESVLLDIPFVRDCIVYGTPSVITGQSVSADIVLNQAVDYVNARKEIRKVCSKRIEPFKIPVKIRFVEEEFHGERFKKNRKRPSNDKGI